MQDCCSGAPDRPQGRKGAPHPARTARDDRGRPLAALAPPAAGALRARFVGLPTVLDRSDSGRGGGQAFTYVARLHGLRPKAAVASLDGIAAVP